MLREGLGAEFPFAKRAVDGLVAAVRSAHVSREAPFWAAVSGFGASWAVGVIGQAVAMVLRVTGLRDPAAWLSGGVAIVGSALAIAVALRGGGRRALLWYAAILGLRTLIQLATALPGFFTFCERSSECPLLQLVLPYVYLAVGVLVSAVAILRLRAGSPGPNAFLNGAGTLSLLTGFEGVVFLFAHPPDAVMASAMTFVLSGAAAFGAGIVLRLRSSRLAPAMLLTGSLLLLWVAVAGPFVWSTLASGGGSQPAALYLSGLTDALALGSGWLGARAVQRARTTAAA